MQEIIHKVNNTYQKVILICKKGRILIGRVH